MVLQIQLSSHPWPALEGCIPFASGTAPTVLGVVITPGSSLSHAVIDLLPAWRMAIEFRHGAQMGANHGGQLSDQLADAADAYLQRYGRPDEAKESRGIIHRAMDTELNTALDDIRNESAIKGLTDARQGAVSLTILLGLPGSGVIDVARQVVRMAGDEQKWAFAPLVLPTFGCDKNFHLDMVTARLDAALAEAQGGHILLAVCGPVSLPALCIHVLQAARGGVRLQSAAACISLTQLFEPDGAGMAVADDEVKRRWRPLLWDQVTAGFCSHVIATDATGHGVQQDENLSRLRQRLRLVNPHADVLRASRSSVDPEVVSELGSSDRFTAMEARRWRGFGPGWAALEPSGVTAVPARLGEGYSMPPPGPLDMQRLQLCLSELFPGSESRVVPAPEVAPAVAAESDKVGIRRAAELAVAKVQAAQKAHDGAEQLAGVLKTWAAERRAFQVGPVCLISLRCTEEGGVGLTLGACGEQVGNLQSLHGVVSEALTGNAYGIEATAHHISLQPLPYPAVTEFVDVGGKPASTRFIASLLQLALPYVPQPKPLRSRASVTPEELKRILDGAQDRPVPEGWLFDGAAWVDYFGSRVYQRPDLEELVAEYLEGVNREIEQSNSRMVA
jgi:hypothetical protein